eukprot:4436324-Amphidinium_carterae.1
MLKGMCMNLSKHRVVARSASRSAWVWSSGRLQIVLSILRCQILSVAQFSLSCLQGLGIVAKYIDASYCASETTCQSRWSKRCQRDSRSSQKSTNQVNNKATNWIDFAAISAWPAFSFRRASHICSRAHSTALFEVRFPLGSSRTFPFRYIHQHTQARKQFLLQ